jgi:transposase
MMAKAYSYDLRKRVVQAIELDGMKKSEAVQVFQVSRNTIYLWLAQKANTGDYQAKPNQPKGNGHKITDWEKFREFVRANGDKTQEEMAKLWEMPISDRTMSRALKKIGFSRKKKLMATEKEMKRKGENSRKS